MYSVKRPTKVTEVFGKHTRLSISIKTQLQPCHRRERDRRISNVVASKTDIFVRDIVDYGKKNLRYRAMRTPIICKFT